MADGTKREPTPAPQDFDPTRSMELVWQGQGGDAQAVNELFARYLPRMRRILSVKIQRWQRSWIDPDDVLQETLIVAVRRFNELEVRTPSSILQWLARIADFEISNRLEYLQAQKRNPAREQRIRLDEDSADTSSGVLVPFAGPSPSQFYARNEIEELIDAHVQLLDPPDYRDVILMRDYYEADWEEIQRCLSRPSVEAVQTLYHRAHRQLRERMSRRLD
jgi:RNA polymerase sigma factor (sigma-70 family)